MARSLYALTGLIVGAAVDILINLLAAGIQQRILPSQLSIQALWILAGLAFLGLLIGYWLGGKVEVSTPSISQPMPQSVPTTTTETITITRSGTPLL